MKHALCVGINDYAWLSPTSSLHGCVVDAREWASLLLDCFGFDSLHLLLDRQATPEAVEASLSLLASRAKPGDTVAFTYSGHGTRVPDSDGDEEDGYDEAIVLQGALYTDDQIAVALSRFKPGVRVVVVADSCHSGTVTRAIAAGPHPNLSRFADISPLPGRLHHRFGAPRDGDQLRVLLAGCKPDQTSADAWLAGGYHGALSFHATRLLRENPRRTWREFGKLLRPCVARTSEQTPQIEGPSALLDQRVFG